MKSLKNHKKKSLGRRLFVAQSSGMAQILPGKVFKVNGRKKKPSRERCYSGSKHEAEVT